MMYVNSNKEPNLQNEPIYKSGKVMKDGQQALTAKTLQGLTE